MKAKHQIFIITSEFPPNVGGIGNHSYNLAKSLSDEGFSVTVLCDVINIDPKERIEFSTKENFKIFWIKRSRFLAKTYLQRIIKALEIASKASTIICSGKFSLWLGLMIGTVIKCKNLIAVVHGSELDLKSTSAKRVTNIALNQFNKIISVSRYTQNHLPNNLKKSIKKYIIPNGIKLDEFTVPLSSTLLQGDPSLITIGSVTERKGQENVVKALPVIKQDFPAVHYHLVGKAVIKLKIELLAKENNITDKVSIYGSVSRQELLKLVSSAKIKLMLSVHTETGQFEGFGIGVLEANALGVPAIGSRNSGIADAIENGKTGVLVDPAEPDEITAAIKNICDNYSSYSSNAKAWAIEHDWKNIVQKYINVIND